MKDTLLNNEDELFQYLAELINGTFLFILVYDKGMLNYGIPKFRRLLTIRLLSVGSEGLLEFLVSGL